MFYTWNKFLYTFVYIYKYIKIFYTEKFEYVRI